jgi:hypothetical protein
VRFFLGRLRGSLPGIVQEFSQLIEDANVVDDFFSTREISLAYVRALETVRCPALCSLLSAVTGWCPHKCFSAVSCHLPSPPPHTHSLTNKISPPLLQSPDEMVSDDHTKMQFVEFLEALGGIAEVRAANLERLMGTRLRRRDRTHDKFEGDGGTTDDDLDFPDDECEVEEGGDVAAGTASAADAAPAADAVPVAAGSGSETGAVDPAASALSEPPAGASAAAGSGAGAGAGAGSTPAPPPHPVASHYVSHDRFLIALGEVLDLICSVVDPDRDVRAQGAASAAVSDLLLIKQNSLRKFKGGGAAVSE